jgi:sporulation protein YlmC with PRC-barrel domain
MKQYSLSFVLIAPLMVGTGLWAADTVVPPTGDMTVLGDTDVHPGTVRATKILDTGILDKDGKDVGKVRDILLDRDRNHVSYILVGHGGAGGVGETLWTVPYQAVAFSGPASKTVYVRIPADTITHSPEFSHAKWASDPDYYRMVDAYYQPHLPAAGGAQPQAQAQVKVDAQPAAAGLGASPLPWTRQVAKLIGRDIVSPGGEHLGDVNDIVLNASTGEVEYVAMTKSKLPGIDERFFAVPAAALRPQGADEKLVLNMQSSELKTMPSFDKGHWPTAPDPAWNRYISTSAAQ